jgi:hypothetical protein
VLIDVLPRLQFAGRGRGCDGNMNGITPGIAVD